MKNKDSFFEILNFEDFLIVKFGKNLFKVTFLNNKVKIKTAKIEDILKTKKIYVLPKIDN
jgi:hypothetical protein